MGGVSAPFRRKKWTIVRRALLNRMEVILSAPPSSPEKVPAERSIHIFLG